MLRPARLLAITMLLACRPTGSAPPPDPAANAPAAGTEPPPAAVLGALEAPTGGLEKDEIRRVVLAHLGDVKTCYDRGLARDPSLTGRVTIQFSIAAGGSVDDAVVQSSELPESARPVADCIAYAARSWKFPDPGGRLLIHYPFVLVPNDSKTPPR